MEVTGKTFKKRQIDLDLVCGLHHVERGQEDPRQGWSWEKSHHDGDNDKQRVLLHTCGELVPDSLQVAGLVERAALRRSRAHSWSLLVTEQ